MSDKQLELENSIDHVGEGIDVLLEDRAKLIAALEGLVLIIESAGLLNLSNGVQLGATSWYVKATDRLEYASHVLRQMVTK